MVPAFHVRQNRVVDGATGALGRLLTGDAARELADPGSYSRGVGYLEDGRVEIGAVGDDEVTAVVRGTVPYDVSIGVRGGGLEWSCSCPVGEGGDFCKHCVAVALTISGAAKPAAERRSPVAAAHAPSVDLRSYVASRSAEELVDLVMEWAEHDWRVHERLTARAAAASGVAIDAKEWSKRVDSAFGSSRRFISYREAPGWADGIDEMIDGLGDLVDSGHADAAIALVERACRKADRAINHIDDSDGHLTAISQRLSSIHIRACELSRPDPVTFARRLVKLELSSELDTFHRAAFSYAHVLGNAGVDEYRRLIDPKWREIDPAADRWSSEVFRLRQARIGVALAARDPDELIMVHERDLAIPDDIVEIVESLRQAGRTEEAIAWGQRGLDVFADRHRQTAKLRELVADLLRSTGDASGALELLWDAFERHPSLGAYRRFLEEADRNGQRETLRQQAIAMLQGQVSDQRPKDRSARSLVDTPPVSALIEILLFEGDVDGAWAAALQHDCPQRLWLTLAKAREKGHPGDAIPVYEREVESQIGAKNNSGYRRAVDLLSRIRPLAAAAGEPERFDELLLRLRQEHKAKRNLMALLDKRGW